MTRGAHLTILTGAAITLAACNGQVNVQIVGERDGEPVPMEGIEVQALPYDRDAIFDSLTAAFSQPEPMVSDSLSDLQQRYTDLQTQYAAAEARWAAIRDSLQQINDRLGQINRASAEYRELFGVYNRLEPQEGQAENRMNSLFEQVDQVRSTYNEQTNDYNTRYEVWADEAFASVDEVIADKLDALGRQPAADTTDANGAVYLSLKKGQWWIHARREEAFEELYWNEPIEVTGGDPVQLLLNRENAEIRRKF